jgi:DNA-binding response OmpR family regulator
MRILVVEDDQPLAELLKAQLQTDHFAVDVVSDASKAERKSADEAYDLVLLDLGLPKGEEGLTALQHIRERNPDVPVLIVAGNGLADSRVRGLDAGADDYLTKPFSFAELSARIRAVLRRGSRPVQSLFQVEDLELDRVSRTVKRSGQLIPLTPKEFSLLEFLMLQAGRPVSRGSIVEQVWRMRGEMLTNVVDVYIKYIRRKIDGGYSHPLIHTVRGVGYQIGGSRPARN